MNNCLRQIVRFKCENKLEAALCASKSAYKIFNDTRYLYEIYDCEVRMNNIKAAIKTLKKLTKLTDCKDFYYKKIAFHYFCLGKFRDSLKYYKIVYKNEATSSNAYSVGCAYHYMNKLKDAEKFYKEALVLDCNNVSAMNNLGLVYYTKKKWQIAIPVFKNAIKINPNHPEAYHHMGIIHRKFIKDLKLSEQYIKRAITLDPKHAENYYELALTYIDMKQKEDAISMLKKCQELKPLHKDSKKLLKKLS